MQAHINNPMNLFPQMRGELMFVGLTPLTVMRQQDVIAWSEVDGKRVSNFQLEVLNAIGQVYPDMAWKPMEDNMVLVHTDDHGHWLIAPSGAYQWSIPNGPVIQIEPGEEHPFMNL